MAQSPALEAESASMRAFDAALQRVAELPPRAQVRVLTFVTDHIAEHLTGQAELALSIAHGTARDAARDAREALDEQDMRTDLAQQAP
jgi:hypothetical protein